MCPPASQLLRLQFPAPFSLLLFHVALEFLVLRETFFQFTPGSLSRVDDAVCWIPSTWHTHLILTFPSLTRLHLGSLAEG